MTVQRSRTPSAGTSGVDGAWGRDGPALAALAAGAPPADRAHHRRATAAVFVAGLAVFATLYAPQALLPELARAFRVSPAASTLVVSVSTAGLATGLLVLGPLSDRRGRTPVLRGSLVAVAVLAVLLAFTPVWWLLLVLRALQGFALAGLPAVAVAYLREELDASASSRAIGLYVSGTAVGGLTGRVLSGFLSEAGGWRAALGGNGALAVACAIAVHLMLPPSRHFRPRTGSGLRRRPPDAPGGDRVLPALYAVAALTMGAFTAVYSVCTFRVEGPPYFLSPALAGLVFLPYLFGSVSSPLASGLAERVGRRAVLPLAMTAMAAGTSLSVLAPLPCLVLGLCVLTSGFFAAHGVASGWVAARAQLAGRAVGRAAGLYAFWYYVGSSVASTLAGRAWQRHGWTGVVLLSDVLCAAGVALGLALVRTRSLADARPPADLPGR